MILSQWNFWTSSLLTYVLSFPLCVFYCVPFHTTCLFSSLTSSLQFMIQLASARTNSTFIVVFVNIVISFQCDTYCIATYFHRISQIISFSQDSRDRSDIGTKSLHHVVSSPPFPRRARFDISRLNRIRYEYPS